MRYFVSDIHLGAGSPEEQLTTERAFCRWLDMVREDATELYLMGDIFDFWFEYRRVVPRGFVRVLARLAALSDRGVRVVFYTGNHDMWCYDYLERECGIELVRGPRVEVFDGRKVHLAHGDNLNVGNQPMLKLMNTIFRSSVARTLFSWLVHPDLALKFGHWWSGESRKSHNKTLMGVDNLSPLVEYARRHHAQNGDVEEYIFGHMHLPYTTREEGFRVLFLGDWSASEAVYATMGDDNILQLKTFTIDETVSRTSR